MNYHPDILAAHAQFGGDLESMQALYDRPNHIERIATLAAEVERLTKELSRFHEERSYIVGWNDGFAHASAAVKVERRKFVGVRVTGGELSPRLQAVYEDEPIASNVAPETKRADQFRKIESILTNQSSGHAPAGELAELILDAIEAVDDILDDPWAQVGFLKEKLRQVEAERDVWKDRAFATRATPAPARRQSSEDRG